MNLKDLLAEAENGSFESFKKYVYNEWATSSYSSFDVNLDPGGSMKGFNFAGLIRKPNKELAQLTDDPEIAKKLASRVPILWVIRGNGMTPDKFQITAKNFKSWHEGDRTIHVELK